MSTAMPQVPGYILIEKIGSGSFSNVYKAYSKTRAHEVVAVKCIDKKFHKKSFANNIVKEISILKVLKNDYIVHMTDFTWNSMHVFIITEYCDEGDLAHFIRRRLRLRETVVQMFMRQLATAIHYLRQHSVCHMDLKPQNLLLQSMPNLMLKVADFGLSEHLSDQGSEHYRWVGSPLYMAPEKLLNQHFDARVDLWAIGIIIYECLFGRPPYPNLTMHVISLMARRVAIQFPPDSYVSPDCEDLIRRLLKHNPDERIEFEHFFRHPFLGLDNMPSANSYNSAHSLVRRAIALDARGRHNDSLPLYEEAVRLLEPLVCTEQDTRKRMVMKIRMNEYVMWVHGLRAYLWGLSAFPLQLSRPSPLSEGDFESLRALATSTPILATALEIGYSGELYMAEGQHPLALHKFTVALGILMSSLHLEPLGLRRNLLHTQVQIWLQLAEAIRKY